MKRKFLSIALTLLMVLSLVPVTGDYGFAAGNNDEPIATLFFASDYQNKDGTNPQQQLSNLMDRVNAGEGEITNAIFCGDYTNGSGYNYGDDPAPNINIINGLVDTKFGTATQSMFLQGNHDTYNSSLMASDGLHEFDNYMVYILNTQSANPWNQGSATNAESTVRASANALTNALNNLTPEQRNKPIFIATHVPLHMSSRTSSKYGSGDNMYSSYLFNAINDAAVDLDIVVLYGHNHSHGWDSYLGGSCVYRPKGSTLPVPDCNGVSGRTDKYTNETLNFTYMNAGYVGYYTENTSPADDTLTCTTIKIYSDSMVVTRYDASGVHKLGSQGAYNINADGGIYNDAGGFGGGSYGSSPAYTVVGSNVASPQSINRINEGMPVLTPALTLSGAHTSVDIGSMDSVKATLKNATVDSYLWETSNSSVAKLLENDKQTVRVEYNKAGTATITCTVNYTAEDETTGSISKAYDVTVNADVTGGAGTRYVKVTNLNEITAGDGYLIVTNAEEKRHLVEKDIITSNSRTGLVAAQALTGAGDNEIVGDYGSYEWTFESSGNSWRLKDKGNSRYVRVATSRDYPASWATRASSATNFSISKTGTDNFNFSYNSNNNFLQLSTGRNLVYGYDSTAATKDFYIYKKAGATSADPAAEIRQANGDAVSVSYAVGATQSFKAKLTNIAEVVSYAWTIEGDTAVASIKDGTADSAAPAVNFKREGQVTLKAVITYKDSNNNAQTIEATQALQVAQAEVNILKANNTIITDVLQRRYEVTNATTEAIRCEQTLSSAGVQYQWSSSDEGIATISGDGANATINFTGQTGYTYITVKVTGTDGSGNSFSEERGVTYYASAEPKTTGTVDYPAYPDEGAIRLDKTAESVGFSTTGIAKVNLQLDGIAATKPKDIVLVADMSSSMDKPITMPDGTTKTRVDVMRESIIPLIDEILGPNADGTPSQNRLAVVAFNNYDYYKISAGNNINYTQNEGNDGFNHETTGTNPVVSGLVGSGGRETLKDITRRDCVVANCKSGTNYDLGLSEAYKILADAKTEANYNRDQVVIFMSDGAPFQYNYFRGYSGNGAAGKGVDWMAWLNGDRNNSTIAGVLRNNSYAGDYINDDGNLWWAEAIKATEDSSCKVIDPYDPAAARNKYIKNVSGLGAKMYTVGFCLEVDAEITLEQMYLTLEKIASAQDMTMYADDAADLDHAFDVITRQLNFAATDAVVTDTIGESYSLQVGNTVNVSGQTHDLTDGSYIGEAPYITVFTQKLNAQRQPTGERVPVEKITFTAGTTGEIQDARSTAVDGGATSIISNGKLNGKYITYDIATKTFTCNVGNVEGDKRYELEYFVNLNGSGTGQAEAGSYATNQAAIATYTNYLGNQCTMDFPVPYMAWKAAHVTYEFYMVNQNGQPINGSGAVVPIEQRETLYTDNRTINLNAEQVAEASVIAGDVLREGYVLYSPDTSYYLRVGSGTNVSQAYIKDGEARQTTLVYRPEGAVYEGGTYNVGGGSYDYKVHIDDYGNTHVLFAVKQKPETISKSVQKVWSDNSNNSGSRPEAITVELQVADPTPEDPKNMATVPGSQVRLSEVNSWQYTWRNLTKYKYVNGNPTGELIDYQVVETAIPEGYAVSYETDVQTGKVTVTNTYMNSYSLKITKENGDHAVLPGAGFKLYSDEGCTQLANVYIDAGLQNPLSGATDDNLWTNSQGEIFFYGLDDGHYWIKEFRTPSGYTLLSQPVKLTVEGADVTVTVNGQTHSATVYDNVINVTVTNQKLDTSIPFTAGIGQYGMLIMSMALIGLVLFLMRRRQKRQLSQNH